MIFAIVQGERCNHAHGPQDLREPKSKAGGIIGLLRGGVQGEGFP